MPSPAILGVFERLAYNAVLWELAAERGLRINDLWYAARNCSFDPLSSDGVHLTPEGTAYIGEVVARAVGEFIDGRMARVLLAAMVTRSSGGLNVTRA